MLIADWVAWILGVGLLVVALLLTIWWRQRSLRWLHVLLLCLVAAPLLSYWSGIAFQVADYRAGCDGLCLGFGGAPVRFTMGEAAGGAFVPGMFAVNCLVYLALLLAWLAIVRTIVGGMQASGPRRPLLQTTLVVILLIGPFMLSPWFLPPPEASVRGDSLRIAINARREVYMYDQLVPSPVLRVALEDVRPRPDRLPGMRVCLRTFTLFYLPTGHLYLDMTPEGVHSNHGGVASLGLTCWD